jgi:hypothetical protein
MKSMAQVQDLPDLQDQTDGQKKQRPQRRYYEEQKKFFDKYEWWFVALGLVGNSFFFLGSICFLSKQLETLAIGLFIAGSCFMLISSGEAALAEYSRSKAN